MFMTPAARRKAARVPGAAYPGWWGRLKGNSGTWSRRFWLRGCPRRRHAGWCPAVQAGRDKSRTRGCKYPRGPASQDAPAEGGAPFAGQARHQPGPGPPLVVAVLSGSGMEAWQSR